MNWKDVIGSEDRVLIKFEIKDGKVLFNVDKPESITWAKFMNIIQYLVAMGISQETGMSIKEALDLIALQDLIDKGVVTTLEMAFK